MGGTPIWLTGGTTTPPPQQDWMRYPLPTWDWMRYPHLELDEVPPHMTGWGYPFPHPQSGDRATERALATQRAVCLLRSRSRTFLFEYKITCKTTPAYRSIICEKSTSTKYQIDYQVQEKCSRGQIESAS